MNQLRNIVFNYIVSPMGFLFMFWGLSWVLMLICGKPLISWLKQRKGMKWAPREDTPDSHGKKAGTPSMGGIGIIGAAFVGFLAVIVFAYGLTTTFASSVGNNLSLELLNLLIFPLFVVLHAVLGYVDDHSKATNRGGISSRAKLLGQIGLAILFLGMLWVLERLMLTMPQGLSTTNSLSILELFSSWSLIVVVLLLIIGTSNAVNLTDGIDGLASGLSLQVAGVFASMLFEAPWQTDEIGLPAVFFWLCLGGACLGFLAFNKYPAKVFMGDTGSLALGAALGAGAILTRTVWLLPFIGFIFFVEMFSVIFQVLYFKWTKKRTGEGKRIFRRAPLHHHFELGGWSEWRVVGTFWAVNLVTSILGLVLWKMGVLPRFP